MPSVVVVVVVALGFGVGVYFAIAGVGVLAVGVGVAIMDDVEGAVGGESRSTRMSEKPKGKEFTGHAAEMRTSPWLASEDVDAIGGSCTLTIEKTMNYGTVPMQDGRTKDKTFTLVFKGAEKEMVLNAGNRKVLMALYGDETKDWIGKKIEIYVDDNVRLAGKRVKGLRLRKPRKADTDDGQTG